MNGSRSFFSRILWFLLGGVVVGLIAANPWGLLPFGDRSGSPAGRTGSDSSGNSAADEVLFYRHPMDPTITSPVMQKDDMGMDYIAVYAEEAAAPTAEREVLFYRHPMDPTITSTVMSKDDMGMDYVAVYAEDAAKPVAKSRGTGLEIRIDPVVVQNMNVQSVEVVRRDLGHPIRTVGYLEYDQERMVSVTTRFSGWIETVYVNYVGEAVKKGQPLFEVYSPELVQTQQELLSAVQYAGRFDHESHEMQGRANALVDAARTRLGYWDISAEQIAEIERSGEILRTLKVTAPTSGVVMKRMDGLEGMAVTPGMATFHIADLSTLWLSVEVFENQVAWIKPGTAADVTFAYFPDENFAGTVRFIEPEFSEKTRTLRVKLGVPNRRGKLRSGMFATVVFNPVATRLALTVPSLAVLRTGERSVIVTDLGGGVFLPREVSLGHEGEGFVEVLEGLSEGDRVVVSAQFLIDSEANLQATIRKMIARSTASTGGSGSSGEAPSGMPMATPAPADEVPHPHSSEPQAE